MYCHPAEDDNTKSKGEKIYGKENSRLFIFIAGAFLILIGAIANGTLFSDQGSIAATYGNFLGTLIPIVLYVLSGSFLLTFDKPTKMNYIDGFKKRSKQSSTSMVFFVLYAILTLGAFAAVLLTITNTTVTIDNIDMFIIEKECPYAVPMGIFAFVLDRYILPHNASKKYFVKNDADLNKYLSANETFCSFSGDDFVLASSKTLYFPKSFCIVPFDQISSIKLKKELGVQYVYFYLSNGKKFYINTKHFDRIQEAINAHSTVQQ